jgi:hypothetical protein
MFLASACQSLQCSVRAGACLSLITVYLLNLIDAIGGVGNSKYHFMRELDESLHASTAQTAEVQQQTRQFRQQQMEVNRLRHRNVNTFSTGTEITILTNNEHAACSNRSC